MERESLTAASIGRGTVVLCIAPLSAAGQVRAAGGPGDSCDRGPFLSRAVHGAKRQRSSYTQCQPLPGHCQDETYLSSGAPSSALPTNSTNLIASQACHDDTSTAGDALSTIRRDRGRRTFRRCHRATGGAGRPSPRALLRSALQERRQRRLPLRVRHIGVLAGSDRGSCQGHD